MGRATTAYLLTCAAIGVADETTSIMKAQTMLQVATIIGDTLSRTRREIAEQCRDLRQ